MLFVHLSVSQPKKGHPMKHLALLSAAVVTACVIASTPFAIGHADDEAVPIFGIKIFPGYRDWRLISVAHEEGNLNDLRAILGNDVAIKAYGTGRFRSRTAQSLRGWPGAMIRRRKTTRSLAVVSPSSPGRPRKGFNSWSRTRRNMPRPAAGGSLSLTMANRSKRRCLNNASPATSPRKGMTSSLRAMHLETGTRGSRRTAAALTNLAANDIA